MLMNTTVICLLTDQDVETLTSSDSQSPLWSTWHPSRTFPSHTHWDKIAHWNTTHTHHNTHTTHTHWDRSPTETTQHHTHHTHTHWDRSPTETTHTPHTHTISSCVCQRTEISAQTSLDEPDWINVWNGDLTFLRADPMTLPSWPQTPLHLLLYLQPYNQIRARRVAHTDPSTCVQTIIHCICNWTLHKIIAVSVFHYVSHLCWFLIGQLILVFPNTSASVASRSQQPDAFWREISCSDRSFWRSGAAEHSYIIIQYNMLSIEKDRKIFYI